MQEFEDAEKKFTDALFIPLPVFPLQLMKDHLLQTIVKYRAKKDLRVLDDHRKFLRGLINDGEQKKKTKKVDKENIPAEQEEEEASVSTVNGTISRPRRKAYTAASNRLLEDQSAKSNKLTTKVKEERISDDDETHSKVDQNVVELPPPKEPVKRARKKKVVKEEDAVKAVTRSTRSKMLESPQVVDAHGRSTRVTRTTVKMSGITEIPVEIETIEVPDDRSDSAKRVRSPSPTPVKKSFRPKRTKVKKSPPKTKTSIASVYEDARDSQDVEDFATPAPGATAIITNQTFIVQQPTVVVTRLSNEMIREIQAATRISGIANVTRVIVPAPTTMDELLTDDDSSAEDKPPSPPISVKVAPSTPLMRNLPLSSSSKKKGLINNISVTLSSFKQTQQKIQEREQQRIEKEEEAIRKREALLQKQSEDKRRKRIEKETKVKQQKETLDKAKQRFVEQQRDKEEKARQAQLEKQERLAKQREESEKRRLIAKQKAEEIRKEEERKKAAEEDEKKVLKQGIKQEKAYHVVRTPAVSARYINEKVPFLPTPDCYDSDDETRPAKIFLPSWNQREAMMRSFRIMQFIETKLRNTCFTMKAQTPDLRELFPNVDPRKLRRKSSAIWKQAPRFTMMPSFE